MNKEDPQTILTEEINPLGGEEKTEKGMEQETLELMGFKLADEEYAIDIMQIKEITIPLALTPIPRAPDYILGILSLRGTILPIFDAKKRIGLPPREKTNRTRIIIVNNGTEQVGILVDDITSAARMPVSAIEPPPPVLKGVEAEYISGVGRVDDRMMIIMNIEEICKMEGSDSL